MGDSELTAAPTSVDVTTPPPAAMQPLGGDPLTDTIPTRPTPPWQQPTTPASQDPEMVAGAAHQSWLGHVMDTVGSILGGDQTLHVTKHPDGSVEVTHDPSTNSEKWGRVAQAALGGAARGLQVGQGPGGPARAAAAGTQFGMAQPQQRLDTANQEAAAEQELMTRNANNALLNQKIVQGAWDNAHLSRDDLQKQEAIALDHSEKLADAGFVPLAMNVKDAATLAKFGAANPQAVGAHMGANGDMIYNEPDGHGGVNFYHLPADAANARTTEGTKVEIRSVDPHDNTKTITTTGTIPSGTKNGDLATRLMAINAQNDAAIKSANENLKARQAGVPKTPAEMVYAKYNGMYPNDPARAAAEASKELQNTPEIRATINEKNAQAAKASAEAKKAELESGTGPQGAELVDSIGSGHIAVDRLGYLAARNPGLLAAVTAKYPDFDSSKVASYISTYKDFTNTKKGSAGAAINAGATAFKHLKELDDLNTIESHIPHTNDYTAYMNKVDTVASELAAFYGNSTIPAINGIKETLTTTAPGNRHRAIQTQAQSMSDKLASYEQSWANAAPSKAYEAPMPGIDTQAQIARAALDPRYTGQQPPATTPAPGPGAPTQSKGNRSIADAMKLPQNQGKKQAEVEADLKKFGYNPVP